MEMAELKIGNIIKQVGGDFPAGQIIVLGMTKSKIYCRAWGMVQRFDVDEFEVVPITKKELLKIGFKPICDSGDTVAKAYGIVILYVSFVAEELSAVYFCFENHIYLDHIKYIHQIQNLHSSLNGKGVEENE